MAELLLDDLRVDAGFEGERGHRVAGVVEPDPRHASPLHRVFEHLREAVRVVLGAGLVDEHVPRVGPRRTERESLLTLPVEMRPQCSDGRRGEQELTLALRLRGRDDHLMVGRRALLGHGERGRFEIDIGPPQAGELTDRRPSRRGSASPPPQSTPSSPSARRAARGRRWPD